MALVVRAILLLTSRKYLIACISVMPLLSLVSLSSHAQQNASNLQVKIQELYVGILGRAADRPGLDYWAEQINAGVLTLENTRAAFTDPAQTEYTEIYGGLDFTQLVIAIYENFLERAPDGPGLEYWVAELTSGRVNPDQMINAIINAVQDPNATGEQSVKDLAVLDNKIAAAIYFTESTKNYVFNLATREAARAAVANVTDDLNTVVASKVLSDGYTGQPLGSVSEFDLWTTAGVKLGSIIINHLAAPIGGGKVTAEVGGRIIVEPDSGGYYHGTTYPIDTTNVISIPGYTRYIEGDVVTQVSFSEDGYPIVITISNICRIQSDELIEKYGGRAILCPINRSISRNKSVITAEVYAEYPFHRFHYPRPVNVEYLLSEEVDHYGSGYAYTPEGDRISSAEYHHSSEMRFNSGGFELSRLRFVVRPINGTTLQLTDDYFLHHDFPRGEIIYNPYQIEGPYVGPVFFPMPRPER